MYFMIVKGLGPDQIFIKGVTQVGEVEPSKDTVPVGIVALGLIQMIEEIFVFRNGSSFFIPDLVAKTQDSLVKIVRFRDIWRRSFSRILL